MKQLLIPEAKRAWRMATMWVGLVAVWFGTIPPDQQLAWLELVGLPPERLPLVLGVAFWVARLWNQPKVHEPPAS